MMTLFSPLILSSCVQIWSGSRIISLVSTVTYLNPAIVGLSVRCRRCEEQIYKLELLTPVGMEINK